MRWTAARMWAWVVTVGLLGALAGGTWAGEADPEKPQLGKAGTEGGSKTDPKQPAGEVEADEPHKPWAFDGGIDYVTAYMFRGYNIVDTGYIFQPYANVTRGFLLREDGSRSLDVYGGVWASISEETPGNSGPRRWNELDLTAGITYNCGPFSIGLEYLYYNSPADDFDDVNEMAVLFGYEHWLSPTIGVYREIDDRGGEQDTYLEFTIEPTLPSCPAVPKLELTVPIILGTSLDGFYTDSRGHNEFFGYVSVGLSASYPLTENWSLVGGVEYMQLLADSVEEANDGTDYKVVGRFGVAFAY